MGGTTEAMWLVALMRDLGRLWSTGRCKSGLSEQGSSDCGKAAPVKVESCGDVHCAAGWGSISLSGDCGKAAPVKVESCGDVHCAAGWGSISLFGYRGPNNTSSVVSWRIVRFFSIYRYQ
jgi:hypothetical protein